MNRLVVRLVLSHLLVAAVAAAATYLVVRQLAPALFDQNLRLGQTGLGPGAPGGQPGQGAQLGAGGQQGLLRQQFGDAVERSLLIGASWGAASAALVGAFAAYRLVRPIDAVRRATRAIAEGRYAVPLPTPGTTELAQLVGDVELLGRNLADTETRRVRLLGEVAHEMRTPLTVIDGTVEAMIDGVLPTDTEQLGLLGEEVRRLRRLSDDLSALSRADEGRLDLRVVDVDLREVVSRAGGRLRAQADDAGLTLDIDCGDEPVAVRADPERIAQVITNLVGNAVRATPSGGSVSVRCTARSDGHGEEGVPGRGARRAQVATVTVSDSGEGLAEQDLERIFERFYRVPGRRAEGRDNGSGIGLTIARGIIRAHGGDLRAVSAGRGRGSTFTVELPRSSEGGT
ncbi:MAG: HAMP domain-containing sensor histidine kinase [Candidatus Phosphoribacter sp.]